MVSVLGFSFSGSGQNAALAFVTLKHWDQRKGAEHSAQAIAGRAFGALSRVRDAFIFAARAAGDSRARHRDRLRVSPRRTAAATATRRWSRRATSCSAMAAQSKVLARRAPGRTRRRAAAADRHRPRPGAAPSASRSTTSTPCCRRRSARPTSTTFRTRGRLQRVVVQADAPDRMQPEDLLQLNVLNNQGKPVPLSAFATTRWITGPIQTIRYNGYPAMRISGDAAPGYSTGEAMDEMERLAAQLPAGLRLRVDRPVARGAALRLDGDDPARASRCLPCSCACRRSTRAGRSRSRCCSRCRSACSARCSARPCAACRTTSSSRSA